MQEKQIFSRFVFLLILFMTMVAFLQQPLMRLFHEFGTAALITDIAMMVLFIVFIWGAKKTGYPAAFFGFNRFKFRSAIVESFVWSVVISALFVFLKMVLLAMIPVYAHKPLFDFWHAATMYHHSTSTIMLMIFSYIFFSSIMQEIIFRGGVQSLLQHFFVGQYSRELAIVATSLMFGMIHLIFSIRLALLMILLSCFWGWLYAKQKTLIGVMLSHVLIGGFAFFVLGVQEMIIY